MTTRTTCKSCDGEIELMIRRGTEYCSQVCEELGTTKQDERLVSAAHH